MKKSALALAIAAVLGMTAAQAESRVTTLYGSARVSVDWNKVKFPDELIPVPFNIDDDNYWEVVNNASRLGVIGAEDLGGGWSAFYQYEFGVDVTGGSKRGTDYWNSNRPRLVGIKSDFGALSLGTQYTPYYNVLGFTDTFNSARSFSTDYFLGGGTGSEAENSSVLGIRIPYFKGLAQVREGKSVVYTTPDWSGFSAQGMITMDGHPAGTNNTNNRSPDAIDVWQANVSYKNGPWFVGGAFLSDRGQYYATNPADLVPGARLTRQTDQQWGLAGGFDNKQFGVALSWQRYKPDATTPPLYNPATNTFQLGRPKVNSYTGQVSWYITQDDILRGTYSRFRADQTGSSGANIWQAGYQHNLSKRTRLWVEYLRSAVQSGNIDNVPDGSTFPSSFDNIRANVVSTGVRHDF